MKAKTMIYLLFMLSLCGLCGCTVSTDVGEETSSPTSVLATPQPTKEVPKTLSTDELKKLPVADRSCLKIKKDTLVKYKGDYQESVRIVLPKQVKRIGTHAFTLPKKLREDTASMKAGYIRIPADVKLERDAFRGTGPLHVTLLDGRKKVEDHSFYRMGELAQGYESRVVLADSIRMIESSALVDVVVDLNRNLERVGYGGLYNATISELPDSLRVLDDYALHWTKMQNGENVAEHLPENLEKIGSCCFDYTYATEGCRVHIPASVKYIGLFAASWSGDEDIDADRRLLPQGYEVDEANRYYKSDENGWLYSKDGKVLYFAYLLPGEDKITIPEGVEKVHDMGLNIFNQDADLEDMVVGLDRVELFWEEEQLGEPY